MAAFTAVQPLADTFFFWLPLYYEAKLVLALYLWCNELEGSQRVWARWVQPAVSRYEPLVDRWLAESKALARDWLHSNSLRLLALAQQKFFQYISQLQQATPGAAARPARRAPARRGSGKARRVVEESEEELEEEEEEVEEEEELAEEEAAPSKGSAKARRKKGGAADELPTSTAAARFSAFSLSSFYSARSSDLQAEDVRAGLKAFPISAEKDE